LSPGERAACVSALGEWALVNRRKLGTNLRVALDHLRRGPIADA
jgi:hypothetical protein